MEESFIISIEESGYFKCSFVWQSHTHWHLRYFTQETDYDWRIRTERSRKEYFCHRQIPVGFRFNWRGEEHLKNVCSFWNEVSEIMLMLSGMCYFYRLSSYVKLIWLKSFSPRLCFCAIPTYVAYWILGHIAVVMYWTCNLLVFLVVIRQPVSLFLSLRPHECYQQVGINHS